MFIARSVLTMSALYLKLDPYMVEAAGIEQNERVAQMRVSDMKIKVLHNPINGMKVRGFIELDKNGTGIQTSYIDAGDYPILADIISSAINERYYSCPWVTSSVVAVLPNTTIVEKVYLVSSFTSHFVLKSKDGQYSLTLRLESDAGNSAGHYCYTLYNERNEAAFQVVGGKDNAEVATAIAAAISAIYQNWLSKAEAFEKSVKIPSDCKECLFHFYEHLLAKAKKANLELSFERYSAKEFIVTNNKQGMTYIVTYDNYTGEDLLYGKSVNDKDSEYKLLVRAPGASELSARSIEGQIFKN